MSFLDLFNKLEEYLPILGSLVGHPELGVLAQKLIDIAEEEIASRQQVTGRTRAEILADAKAVYAEAKEENDKLKALGHE